MGGLRLFVFGSWCWLPVDFSSTRNETSIFDALGIECWSIESLRRGHRCKVFHLPNRGASLSIELSPGALSCLEPREVGSRLA